MNRTAVVGVLGVILCGLGLCACATAATLVLPAFNQAAEQVPVGASVSVVSRCNGVLVIGSCNTTVEQTQEQARPQKAYDMPDSALWAMASAATVLIFGGMCVGTLVVFGGQRRP